MKTKILLTFLLTLAAGSQASATCNMANEVFCPVNMASDKVLVAVHNSARQYCGLKILSNQNSGLEDEFTKNLEAAVVPDNDPLSVIGQLGGVIIADSKGKLPILFVAHIQIKTKTGESFEDLAKRTLDIDLLDGDPALAIVTVKCKN